MSEQAQARRHEPVRFGYLGPAGTFAEVALRTVSEPEDELVPFATVPGALEAVRTGAVVGAVVPHQDSGDGAVADTLDELAHGGLLQVVGEVLLPLEFVLLARPGTTLKDVLVVATHPHAEAQCRTWLHEHLPEAEVVFTPSTADAARAVARNRYDAAVAAPLAGEHYGLSVLADDVQDGKGTTHFFLVTAPGPHPDPTGADRTTVFASLRDDRPGALLAVLAEFAVRGISLSRIESRPQREQPGRASIALDCEGHVADARVGDALAALHRVCADVRVLGSYPRADGRAAEVRPGTSDEDFEAARVWLAGVRDGGDQA
ncbi:MAG: Prephenate dehydratase [Frankiales bacterium]|nr:Prephenate dehydratase [Frankiales bacterium]